MSDKYILDTAGVPQPCHDLRLWMEWFDKAERHVAQDKIGDVRISTVFLGLDHSFGGAIPILFETMIFGGEHDQFQDRYETREQALKGHQKAVALVSGAEALDQQ
jgi:hypothetical protein